MFILRNLLCLALAPLAVLATVAQVESDIGAITDQVAALSSEVQNFNGSIPGALDIHARAENINTAVQKATTDTDATPGPISEADGQVVLTLVEGLRDIIVQLLSNLISQKPTFGNIPLGTTIVLNDLKTLNASTVAFEGKLLEKTPPALVPQAELLADGINGGFTKAIAAYNS